MNQATNTRAASRAARRALPAFALGLGLALAGASAFGQTTPALRLIHPPAPVAGPGGVGVVDAAPSFEAGRRLFASDTFDGNGRRCATCHEPRNEFTISPDLAKARYAEDPTQPLFRPIDSNDGDGLDYSNVLNLAVFRVTIPLAPQVHVEGDPGRRSISVWRGVPSITNTVLTAPYGQDGRIDTLQDQARGAIHDHMEPGREPLGFELDSLALYEQQIFYPQRLESLLETDDPLPKTAGFSIPTPSAASQRGKVTFDQNCARCHSGELLHRPKRATDPIFATVFVSEENKPGLPLFRLVFDLPDGSQQTVETPDPGRAAQTGRIEDLNAFETPSLRGLKHTAPYFHDSSAATLRDLIVHYNDFFGFSITGQRMDDLIAYLELL